MGSDPGSNLPTKEQGLSSKIDSEYREQSGGERCNICGLIARNNIELEDHIKHAHKQKDPSNTDNKFSAEQKIDPFIKTED
jgi:hypothetical protein